ncbi:MAG: arylsulfatase, partial [Vicinamibacteraceae bacterium]
YMRWYGDLMWLFIPIQDKLDAFLRDFEKYPHQGGAPISPGGINYQALAMRDALRRLKEMEALFRPR